jgi:hypothetical protein
VPATDETPEFVRFIPSRVDGLPGVSEVTIRPDRIELVSAGRPVVFRFADIARWPRPRWWYRRRHALGWRGWSPVADRDWFHAPPGRYFTFYTTPAVTVYMPDDEPHARGESNFARVQEVLAAGGYCTLDLG